MQPHPLANIFLAKLVRFGRNLDKIKAKSGQNLGKSGKFD